MTGPYAGTPPTGSGATGMSAGSGATGVSAGSSSLGRASDAADDGRSLSDVGSLIGEIGQNLSTLISQETALAKAEITASAKRGGKGAGLLSGAGVAGHFVLLFLSIALWWGLGEQIGHGWSAVVVAVLWAVVAGVLGLMGRKELEKIKGIPQTTATAKEIPDALKGNEDSA